MVWSIAATSATCGRWTYMALPVVTFSPDSEAGPTPFVSLAGLTIDLSGPDHVLASLSPRQAKAEGLLTSGTCGRTGIGTSSSADLTSCLASRLTKQLTGS